MFDFQDIEMLSKSFKHFTTKVVKRKSRSNVKSRSKVKKSRTWTFLTLKYHPNHPKHSRHFQRSYH